MAGLPTTGEISLSQIAGEFGGEKPHGLNEYYKSPNGLVPASTTNNKVPTSGQISFDNFYGAVNRVSGSGAKVTLDNLQVGYLNYVFNPSKLGTNYVSGSTDAVLFINSGVYVWSDDTSLPGLEISGWTTGDTVTIVNNGIIMGRGGNGGGISTRTYVQSDLYGKNGGTALKVSYTIKSFTNNGYIAGGGGGGGGGNAFGTAGGMPATGGGGAGGGYGGVFYGFFEPTSTTNEMSMGGATGGSPRNVGLNAPLTADILTSGTWKGYPTPGAGGGRVIPGLGGAGTSMGGLGSSTLIYAKGGGSGGGGGAGWTAYRLSTGGIQYPYRHSGGGGGGYGAAGAVGYQALGQKSPDVTIGGNGGDANNVGSVGATTTVVTITITNQGGVGGRAVEFAGGSITWDDTAVGWNTRIYGNYT